MMNIKSVLILMAGLVWMGHVAFADVIYQENFGSTPGLNMALTNVGWNASYGSSGTTYTGTVGTVAPVQSGNLVMWQKLAAGTGPTLGWTDEADFGAINLITNISMNLSNDSGAEKLQVALKVNGSWYVSSNMFTGGSGGITWVTRNLAVQSVSWMGLTFVADNTLAVGTSAILPSTGDLQAVGVFNASATGSSVRVDDFTVETIPEPATMSMIVFSAIGLLILRRRHLR